MKEIKLFRLLSSEQIIGFFQEETKDSIIINYPLEIIIEYLNETEKHELSAIKWSPFSDDITTEINKSLIISINNPKNELIEYYKTKINNLYFDYGENIDSKTDEEEYYLSILNSFDDDTEH